MAKKTPPKKPAQKKATRPAPRTSVKRENIIERVAEELESRFFEGAELATETTSAETNIALAALGAIEAPHDAEPAPAPKATHGKRKTTRSKTR